MRTAQSRAAWRWAAVAGWPRAGQRGTVDGAEQGNPWPRHWAAASRAARGYVAVSCSGSEEGMIYKGASVDIDASTELVRRIRKLAPRIGVFGGLYPHETFH